jgi:hypothetical protein
VRPAPEGFFEVIIEVQSLGTLRNFPTIASNLGEHQNEKDPGIDGGHGGPIGDIVVRPGS